MFFYFHQSAEVEVVFLVLLVCLSAGWHKNCQTSRNMVKRWRMGRKKENLGISLVDRAYCANILSYPSFFLNKSDK